MTTLYHFAAPVKSTPFGRGILATRPTHTAAYTSADLAWLVEDNARREAEARELDRHVDEMFAEAEAIRLMELGLCC